MASTNMARSRKGFSSRSNLGSTAGMTESLTGSWGSQFELQTAEARIKHRALLTWQDIRKS